MRSKEKIRKWLLNNCVDKEGRLDLSNLDFGDFDGDIHINNLKVKKDLYVCSEQVKGNLCMFEEDVEGDLYQTWQKVKGKMYLDDKAKKEIYKEILDKYEVHEPPTTEDYIILNEKYNSIVDELADCRILLHKTNDELESLKEKK